jgi:hypothetical protein
MTGGVQIVDRARAPDAAADRRAGRRTLLLLGFMLSASIVVNGTSLRTEAARTGSRITWQETWLLEITSHVAIFALAPLFIPLLQRWPVVGGDWRRFVPAHLVGALAFSLLHVSAMFGARKLLFPLAVGIPYRMDLMAPRNLLYEMRKDVFTYAMLLVGFVLMRVVEQRRLEAEAALQTARREHKLTLKSGGAAFVVEASEVLWAKAAANYVEVGTRDKTYLARMTLTALERLLSAAGARHMRVHRSFVVNVDEVREVAPTGEGDVRLTMSDGSVTPGSRRYRERLAAAIRERAPLGTEPAAPVDHEVRH